LEAEFFLKVAELRPVGVLDPNALACMFIFLYGELGDLERPEKDDLLLVVLIMLY
jgi:hypothetical protein